MNTLDPERRQQMVEAIATWLDDLTEAEPPPAGLPPEVMGHSEPVPDLFSMLSQLTALTRETQLQGRATSRSACRAERRPHTTDRNCDQP